MERKRYRFLDNIRGITLLSMIAYHIVWDLVYIFGCKLEWYRSEIGYFWQQSICWTFITLSGFCWCLGRKKLKRGVIVLGAGMLITIVTLLAMPENRVVFGVLTLLGTCMLLQILLEPIWKRCNSLAGVVCAFVSFLLLRNVNRAIWELESYSLWNCRKVCTIICLQPFWDLQKVDSFQQIISH